MSDNESDESIASYDNIRNAKKYNQLETNILNYWKDDWFKFLTTTGGISPNNLYKHANYYKIIPIDAEQEPQKKSSRKVSKSKINPSVIPANQLFQLIENEANWSTLNWLHVSANPTVTFNYMILHKNFPWNWRNAHNKLDFDVNAIITHDDIPWNWFYLSGTDKIPLQFIIENKNKPWDWSEVCSSKIITVDIIDDNPDIPWNWNAMLNNFESVEYIIVKYIDKPWDWLRIYNDYSDTLIPEFRIMLKNMFEEKMLLSPNQQQIYHDEEDDDEFSWNYVASTSPFLTPELLLKYRHLQFEWNYVTVNRQIPLDFIKQHMELPWSFPRITSRKDFKMDIVLEYPEKAWNWNVITNKMTFGQIKSMPNLRWNWDIIRKRAYRKEQHEYVKNQSVKFLLLAMLNFYEEGQTQLSPQTQQPLDYELADYVFANSYLVKFMIYY